MTDKKKFIYKTIEWEVRGNDFLSVEVVPNGLIYNGDLRLGGYGGEYREGFQTFSDFFNNGPLSGMPHEIANELRLFLISHGFKKGSKLSVSFHNKLEGLYFQKLFINLNGKLLKYTDVLSFEENNMITVFNGPVLPRQYELNLFINMIYEGGKKVNLKIESSVQFKKDQGENDIVFEFIKDEEEVVKVICINNNQRMIIDTNIVKIYS